MTLLLVDAANVFFRAFHGAPRLTRGDGMPVGALYGAVQILTSALRKVNPSHVVFAFEDGKGTFRTKIDPMYKSHRRGDRDPDLTRQMGPFRDLCAILGNIAEAPNFEADDVIATLALMANNVGMETVILSNDKDMLALVRDGIMVLSRTKVGIEYRDRWYRDGDDVMAEWGVRPDQVTDLLSLTGDVVDHIAGIPGIGPGHASKVIRFFGTLDLALAEPEKFKSPRIAQLLRDYGDVALAARMLVKLRFDAPASEGWMQPRREATADLLTFYDAYEFTSFANKLRGIAP